MKETTCVNPDCGSCLEGPAVFCGACLDESERHTLSLIQQEEERIREDRRAAVLGLPEVRP